jgi:hypothetical protein
MKKKKKNGRSIPLHEPLFLQHVSIRVQEHRNLSFVCLLLVYLMFLSVTQDTASNNSFTDK